MSFEFRGLLLRLLGCCSMLCVLCAPAYGTAPGAPYNTPHAPLLGSAWYPEQWPESRWEADLALMEQAHFSVVRVGEFAWSAMEPEEGHFDLGWLDRAIALAAQHHLAVVIGTPTDAPPAWLTRKYPQTLPVDETGRRAEHGGRRQFNYADPLYRQLCARIVRELGDRYGHNPAVIGWQIGNEYTDESFDPATRAQFQQFLHSRYGTLANLNARWTTAYWSQTYSAWSQIPLAARNGNPGLLLEHKHFVTATWRSFQRNQIDALRPRINPRQFITTNIGGLAWSDNWDHYAITADLDLASWDDYVGQGHLDATKNAMLNDFVRGWRRENFWVMETQPGSVNWAPVNNALAPGETRALAWQAVGHGADAVLYWQWRSALNGQEQYHGAVVGPDGKPLPLYPELERLGDEFSRVHAALAGTSPHAQVALLHTYDSRWAIDFQPHSREYDQEQILLRFYAPLERLAESRGESVDIVDPTTAPLDGYKVLVAPSLNVIDEPLADRLLAWVRAGGHLLLGPRSGMKDGFNALNPQRQPGPLSTALGAKVEQFYALASPVNITGVTPSDHIPQGSADIWGEPLSIADPDTKVLARFIDPDGWLDGEPAYVSRRVGKGSLSYLGALPDPAMLQSMLTAVQPPATQSALVLAPLPADVEACTRWAADHVVLILINHGHGGASVSLPLSMQDLLHPEAAPVTHVDLGVQGVAVLTANIHP